MKRAIVWFRNDLRLHDHGPLRKAIAEAVEVIPVYVFDENKWRLHQLGFPKTGSFQTRFILESVNHLKESLQQCGADLIIRKGNSPDIISELALEWKVDAVYTSKEVTSEEILQEEQLYDKLRRHQITLDLSWHSTLFHRDDLPWPIDQLPDIFTDFRKQNEKQTPIRNSFKKPDQIAFPSCLDVGEIPTIEDFGFVKDQVALDDRAVLGFKGGEKSAWDRLNHYLWQTDQLKNYKWTRNGLIGADYSSKFSAWLAHGCISPKAIYEEVTRFEKERKKNVSTYWLIFELIWRDYFRFVALKYGTSIFKSGGIKDRTPKMNQDYNLFEKWRFGQTGVPFVDANMRELLHTGFMSNRGRQNVASFLVKDLGIDWRWGAAWFESQLIDYDVCSNWGNWMYVAGVGNDPRENRYFNILNQAKKYDAEGEYVRLWLPELSAVSTGEVHIPTAIAPDRLKLLGISLGQNYPKPLVNMNKWIL